MKLFDLTGRVAIVTGGNGGIGLGMARGLAQAGAAVVVAARNPRKNSAAVTALEALGAKALAIEVDVRDEASCRALVAQALERLGRLDVLVNNAGTNIRKLPQDYTLEEGAAPGRDRVSRVERRDRLLRGPASRWRAGVSPGRKLVFGPRL